MNKAVVTFVGRFLHEYKFSAHLGKYQKEQLLGYIILFFRVSFLFDHEFSKMPSDARRAKGLFKLQTVADPSHQVADSLGWRAVSVERLLSLPMWFLQSLNTVFSASIQSTEVKPRPMCL